jgi:G3E family GTPase
MVELENGCICCSINNNFIDLIFRILARDRRVDYLVVETTGLADPLPVVLTILRTEFRDLTRVDSIITVADAGSFCLDLFDSEAAHKSAALRRRHPAQQVRPGRRAAAAHAR